MFKPHEFAKKLGLSVKILQRWDVAGKLPAKPTLSGHRFYTEDDWVSEIGGGLNFKRKKFLAILNKEIQS